MSINMRNIAHTREYLDLFSKTYGMAHTPGCTVEEEHRELGNGISILSTTNIYCYYPDDSEIQHRVFGSKNIIYRNDKKIYSFDTINDDSRCKVFTHRNGHEYLFFKRDLYGYSILDLNNMQDLDYFPAASFPEGETFILCEPFYNPINNIVAVDGCFWAAPYGVVLIDFTAPLSSSQQIEKHGYIEEIYNDNYGYTFKAWNRTDLILMDEKDPPELKNISNDEYITWFQNKSET